MQAKKAAAIREEWGDEPCEHPKFAKEYSAGARTGDYVCTQCGAKVTFRERAEILASRKT
jgi:DNA-directed RNA polymerase subunit RPC12/RpoP